MLEATHLVAGGSGVPLKRTPKLLAGIGQCRFVVDVEWLYQSAKEGKLLDGLEFVLCDDEVWGSAVHPSRSCERVLERCGACVCLCVVCACLPLCTSVFFLCFCFCVARSGLTLLLLASALSDAAAPACVCLVHISCVLPVCLCVFVFSCVSACHSDRGVMLFAGGCDVLVCARDWFESLKERSRHPFLRA